ncbi:hypothetical protein EG68_06353 [Paragonimus skrjabini miyazakii]|uniref:Uncharacterized protein n=1 Tax=Paragonimus skrjabini miyazakii TaxID=59628 RepID=A0A8S9YPW4_9TREM|nr:hypothetical protein EG68_06353 [Paragonimus skrjabini miyazakii]
MSNSADYSEEIGGTLSHCSAVAFRSALIDLLNRKIQEVQAVYHEDLVELNFIQSGALLIDFPSWRRKKSQELMQALCSGHLDPEDLALISRFMSGHVRSEEFFPSYVNRSKEFSLSETDVDSEDDERCLDELSLHRFAAEELRILKRIADLKRAGLWSLDEKTILDGTGIGCSDPAPSLSSLAPPVSEQTERVYSDYLFAELQWLAEDFKRERQWKKTSAKRLALASVKAYREKTERSMRAGKEEVVRNRKLCSTIARMVRDWWRQIDKIVHAKQQARLSVKRHQAITMHLGRVLETTEEYTRWLTDGIAGTVTGEQARTGDLMDGGLSESTSDMPDCGPMSERRQTMVEGPTGISKRPREVGDEAVVDADLSDADFTADENALAAAEDDEETIEREEQEAVASSNCEPADVEIAQLTADANCPIEDLLPPDYFDYQPERSLSSSSSSPAANTEDDELSVMETDVKPDFRQVDDSFKVDSNEETLLDDEKTIEAEERLEQRKRVAALSKPVTESDHQQDVLDQNPSDEIAQLEMEAEMPLDSLLSNYYNRVQLNEVDCGADVDMTGAKSESELSSSSDGSDTTTSSGEESDDDRTNSTVTSTEPDMTVDKTYPSQDTQKDELISHVPVSSASSESQQNLEALTVEALKVQPTSTTSSGSSASITVPFLLSGGQLREYQQVGLSWLAAIYQKRLNGILADEMGLGKTIQTIALLAYLACDHGIWGPHLIVVPTSVILNWEIEFKRWCPGFKILTYFGSVKERKERRKGWTKTNAFHVCITSYRLAIQDAPVFKRKKWKYLILDEAQNIKNFKSQRWQTLLTFNSQRRLLLTGTPLQNSLIELWSLMHFLMPNVFQSRRDFQEWFASPLTGMIEGNSEYNEQLVARLHKVLRPFLLRRLKADVERQMPKKFEHVIMCRLSRRQRFLYDDFMSLGSTRETLKSGQFLSVMNVLMQLRKVCNHPNLFETRPILSPFHVADHMLQFPLPRLIAALSHPFLVLAPASHGGPSPVSNASAFTEPGLDWLDRAGTAARLLGQMSNLAEMARDLPTFVARRCRDLCARSGLISVVDTLEVVDDVVAQRKSLSALGHSDASQLEGPHTVTSSGPEFFNRHVVKTVNESLHLRSVIYPNLPHPLPIDPVIVETAPPVRPGNTGMPKSILHNRAIERRHRLMLISRINERRCEIPVISPLAHHGKPGFIADSGQYSSRIGPDVVHLVTRMVRYSMEKSSDLHSAVYPGLVYGMSACQRSVHWWPSRHEFHNSDRNHTTQSRIQQAACLPSSRMSSVQRFNAEAPWARQWYWSQDCTPLRLMLSSPADRLTDLSETLNKFACIVPAVISSGFSVHTSCPQYQSQSLGQADRLNLLLQADCLPPVCQPVNVSLSSDSLRGRSNKANLSDFVPLSPLAWLMPVQLHRIASACHIQFPDPRLIQYDCGKLQRLSLLLRELKAGNHRVLIFTQMARMLDILEQFLAYHGHRYVRLDGTTKVEHRQVLMERFNQDAQIFVFILSTRSGGLGVNLTGADTVIFYDSDWNPTMDAQAQDRCHRIGQTRDVHIYRLISERTVEENILRKANQKRFLSDVAIEGGRFTTAFFKQNTISELFAEPSGLHDLVLAKQRRDDAVSSGESTASSIVPVSEPQSPLAISKPPVLVTRSGRQVRLRDDAAGTTFAALAPPVIPSTDETQLAALLEACEDENDRIAAKLAMAEAKADLAEFDETIPFEDSATNQRVLNDLSGNVELSRDSDANDVADPIAQFALKRRREFTGQPKEQDRTECEEADLTPQPPEQTTLAEETVEKSVERELVEFESTLRPIERFGIRLVEDQREEVLNEELVLADAQFAESKETWRLDQLKALHAADEERAEIEEDDMLYCYGSYDPSAQHLAELERLERLIAEEEAAGDSSVPTPGQRGRKARISKQLPGTNGKHGGTRDRLHITQSSLQTDTSATDAGYGEPLTVGRLNSGRSCSRPLYAETSDTDDDNLDTTHLERFGVTHNSSTRRQQTNRAVQQWENFESSGTEQNATQQEIRKSRYLGVSETETNVDETVSSGKRKGAPISFFPVRKVPKLHPKVYVANGMDSSDQFTVVLPKRRGRPPTKSQNRAVPGSFVRSTVPRSNLTSHAGASNRPLASGVDGRAIPMHTVSTDGPGDVACEEVVECSTTNELSLFETFDHHRYALLGAGRGRPTIRPRPVCVRPARPTMCNTSKHVPTILKSTSTSDLSRLDMSNHPNAHPTRFASDTTVTTQPSRASVTAKSHPGFFVPSRMEYPTKQSQPPPAAQRPPEPVIPVQSVVTGMRASLPAGQLFTPSGQPVFVITRQMKTPNGEVYQQRFTHPVLPPPQFTQVVHQLTRPESTRPPFSARVSSTSVSQFTARPSVMPAVQRIPIMRLNSPAKCIQPLLGVVTTSNQLFPQSSPLNATVPVLMSSGACAPIPVIRVLTNDTVRTNSCFRLISPGNCTPSYTGTSAHLDANSMQQPTLFGIAPHGSLSVPLTVNRPVSVDPTSSGAHSGTLHPNVMDSQTIRCRRFFPTFSNKSPLPGS